MNKKYDPREKKGGKIMKSRLYPPIIAFLAVTVALSGCIAAIVVVTLDGINDGSAVWTLVQKHDGSYSVLLKSGTWGVNSLGRLWFPVNIPLDDFESINFWYMIAPDAVETPSQDFITFRPDPLATKGYLSPYVVLEIIDTGGDGHWIISQQLALLAADKGTWKKFDSTATNLHHMDVANQPMRWHDEVAPLTWVFLSDLKTKYAGATIIKIKVAMGEWTATECQSAYVDDVTVPGFWVYYLEYPGIIFLNVPA